MDSVNGRNQPQIESGTLRCMEKQKHMAEKAAQELCIDFRSSSSRKNSKMPHLFLSLALVWSNQRRNSIYCLLTDRIHTGQCLFTFKQTLGIYHKES